MLDAADKELLSYPKLIRRMSELEERHGMSSVEFLRRWHELPDHPDWELWLKCCRVKNVLMRTYRKVLRRYGYLRGMGLSYEELYARQDLAEQFPEAFQFAREAWEQLKSEGRPPVLADLTPDGTITLLS